MNAEFGGDVAAVVDQHRHIFLFVFRFAGHRSPKGVDRYCTKRNVETGCCGLYLLGQRVAVLRSGAEVRHHRDQAERHRGDE